MKFIENKGIDYILSKYDINKKNLINWFIRKNFSINDIHIKENNDCFIDNMADGYLCQITNKNTGLECSGCIFCSYDNNKEDVSKVIEFFKNILKKHL